MKHILTQCYGEYEYGNTAAYWATYVYFINMVYCELLCTVRKMTLKVH